MEGGSHFQISSDTPSSSENTFIHPDGLLTARNLVRLVMARKMEDDKRPRNRPGSQETLTNSFHVSRPIRNLSTTLPDTLQQVLTFNEARPNPLKRPSAIEEQSMKKPRLGKTVKAKRPPKRRAVDKEATKYILPDDVWLRIFELTPPQFLGKARLVCKEWRGWVDKFTSVYVNCRKENYGNDMPPPPLGLTERQYSNLLGTKGCLEPGCPDKAASRTHWSWAKRWCQNCWKGKIEREDKLIKNRADRMGSRTTFMKLLECIPVGMHDSFNKPHDYVEMDDSRPRAAPRLYKYYLKEDVEKIIQRYDSLTPEPYRPDPNKNSEENAAAHGAHQDEMSKLEEKRNNWLATEKAKIDAHMALVRRIEAGVRHRREQHRTPYDKNRNARKELFTRRAHEDLPHIDEGFVKNTKAFKAATRVFRDGGTERGWQTLKPKIEKEWAERCRDKDPMNSSIDGSLLDGIAEWLHTPDDSLFDEIDLDDFLNPQGHQDLLRSSQGHGFAGVEKASYGNMQTQAMTHVCRQPTPLRPPPSTPLSYYNGSAPGQSSIHGLFALPTSHTPSYGRPADMNKINTTRWQPQERSLPFPPSNPIYTTSVNHSYPSYSPASSVFGSGSVFPGVLPPVVRAPAGNNNSRSSLISISSLVNQSDS